MDSRRSISLDDIQTWNVCRGVGCIVMEWRGDWHALACDSVRLGGKRQTEKPARICRRCREALPHLEAITGGTLPARTAGGKR